MVGVGEGEEWLEEGLEWRKVWRGKVEEWSRGGTVGAEEWLEWGKVEEDLEWEDGWSRGRSKRRKVWSGEMVGVEEWLKRRNGGSGEMIGVVE